MDVLAGLDHRSQQVVRGVDVVVHRVALGPRALHRIRRGALLGEVDDGVRVLGVDELQQPRVVVGHVDAVEADGLAGDFLPRLQPFVNAADRGQRLGFELGVDGAPGEVVNDVHVVALVGQVEGCGPTAESVPAKNGYLHCVILQ